MTRFETPGQVVLLFTGVAVISVVLIALLNVEAKNRKMKEPEIENGNLFQALGRQIARWTKSLGHLHSSGGGVQSDFSASVVKRSLSSMRHDGDAKAQHPVRHHGKHRRKLEPPVNVSTTMVSPSAEGNQTSPHSRRLASHDACYSTNQVLLVIAVTCAVNFAFIFVVMTLVHVCNRAGSKLSGLDSVVLAEDGDCDIHDQKLPLDRSSLRRQVSSYSSVQEYVNSLPGSFDRTASMPSMLSLHSLHAARKPSQENLLTKSNSLHTSYSMENLLFLG